MRPAASCRATVKYPDNPRHHVVRLAIYAAVRARTSQMST